MVARDIMTPEVVTVGVSDTVRQVGQTMLKSGYAALPVVDDDYKLVGLVSESDVLSVILPEYLDSVGDLSFLPSSYEIPDEEMHDLDTMTADHIMRKAILRTVGPDEPAIEIARIMVREHIRRCPVVQNDRLVGIVSRRDLMEAIVRPTLEAAGQ